MLDGLALGRRGAAGDSATDEDDELLDARSLEIAEVRDVGGVGEDDGIRGFGSGLEDEQGGDLHSCLRWIGGCVTTKRLNGRGRTGVGTWENENFLSGGEKEL